MEFLLLVRKALDMPQIPDPQCSEGLWKATPSEPHALLVRATEQQGSASVARVSQWVRAERGLAGG